MTPKGEFVGALATSWEQDKADPKRWIFKLRDAKWSDGTPFTAKDVKFTYEYIMKPENKSSLISRVDTVAGVTVIDDHTAAVITKSADPLLPRRSFLVFMLPEHIFTNPSLGPQSFANKPVGTGSYIIDAYQQNSLIRLKKNPNSWRGTKGLDNVEMRIITEATTRMSAYEANQIDFMESVPRSEATRVKSLPNTATVTPAATGYYGWDMDYFNPPFNDKRVRIAMAHSLDYDTILKQIYFGYGEVMSGQMLTSGTFGFNPNIKPYTYDPAMSKRLLAEAGYPNGFSTQMEFLTGQDPEAKRFAEACASYFKDVGVNCTITPIDLNTWRDGLYARRPRSPLYYNTWSSFAVREASFALQWMATENPGKYYGNTQFNDLYHQALVELDENKRLQLYRQAVQIMHDDPPGLWVAASPAIAAYRTTKIANYEAMSGPTIYFDEIQMLA